MTSESARDFSRFFETIVSEVGRAVVGNPKAIRLATACLLSGGHLLIEDKPGTGKTLLAKALARAFGGKQSRIQFTPDLLPSDINGSSVYSQKTGEFTFRPGPIFASVVVADEINRASPKTQSALLEVMEENNVTIDIETHAMLQPFMVIATQNPIEQAGTYPLPEAQLDRFLMKISLQYPDLYTSIELLGDPIGQNRLPLVKTCTNAQEVMAWRQQAMDVHVDRSVLEFMARLAQASRDGFPGVVDVGLSVRGSLAFMRLARVWAAAAGRAYVTPDDIIDLIHPVLVHRLVLSPEASMNRKTVKAVIDDLLELVKPQLERGFAPEPNGRPMAAAAAAPAASEWAGERYAAPRTNEAYGYPSRSEYDAQ